jgi:hypothetical protein
MAQRCDRASECAVCPMTVCAEDRDPGCPWCGEHKAPAEVEGHVVCVACAPSVRAWIDETNAG